MNGPHDMGGFTGFGPVLHEDDEPVWHADWEPRAFALVLAMGMEHRRGPPRPRTAARDAILALQLLRDAPLRTDPAAD
jgi:hypothetical protein